ncbi:MAG: hypothetical protein L7V88_03105 [Alphaproteobacteria bacterium]|nr:hypothetical protein [Alphaproteobacteria bacterium]
MSNEKPVFTIANMPSVAQDETAPINDVQPDIQTEQTGLSEDKQGEPVSETLELETPVSETPEAETIKPEPVIKQALSPEKISPENISQEKIAEPELEQQAKAPSLPEPLTSAEIASLITMPPSIQAPPPLERIKIGALLNTDSSALKSIMGVPDFMLKNGQMKLWQYDVGKCIIDFYLRQKEYDYSVTFIDIRARMLGDTTNEQACEAELTQALNS